MDWSPFDVCAPGERAPSSRSMHSREGVGDRLRTAAFAELQAREAFRWAAAELPGATDELRRAWRALAAAEHRHLGWLLDRMGELGTTAGERPVSDFLWRTLRAAPDARRFAAAMAGAEERGRVAGERFERALAVHDPVSARLFGRIAAEEVEHVRLAERFFPELRGQGA